MTLRLRTLTGSQGGSAQPLFDNEDYDSYRADSTIWTYRTNIFVDLDPLTDTEKALIEQRLDSEGNASQLSFSSPKEALEFLRSKMQRPHV